MTSRRLKVLDRDNYRCRICLEDENPDYLEVHHITPIRIGGTNDVNNLITVCKSCHLFMHCNPKLAMKEKITISENTKIGLIKATLNGRPPGRREGSKDKKPRRTTGYYLRYRKGETR